MILQKKLQSRPSRKRIISDTENACVFIRYFTHLTRPTQDAEFCNPTRPVSSSKGPYFACSTLAYTCLNSVVEVDGFLVDSLNLEVHDVKNSDGRFD